MNLRNIYNLFNMSNEELSSYFEGIGISEETYIGELISCVREIMAPFNTPDVQIAPLGNYVFHRFLVGVLNNHVNETGCTLAIDRTLASFNWNRESFRAIKIGDHFVLMYDNQCSDFLRIISLLQDGRPSEGSEDMEEVYGIMNSYGDENTPISVEAHEYLVQIGIETQDPQIIPENSESLSVKENTSRFSTAMWYDAIQTKIVVLAGVGGIGSYVGFLISRFHPRAMFIYDDDRVEAANMSGQLYGKTDIGKFKVDALSNMVNNYADFGSVFAINQRFTEDSEPSDIMICGFDNMEARRLFFNKWRNMVENKAPEDRCHCLFLDGRLAAEDLQVLCITGDNLEGIQEYHSKYLFSDEEADETICSYKQTTYMANMIGSIISNLFVNFVANDLVGAPIRELPFLTQYSGTTMQFKIE